MSDPIKHAEHCKVWRESHKDTIKAYNRLYFRARKLKEAGKDTEGKTPQEIEDAYNTMMAAKRMNRIVKAATVPIDTSFFPPMPPPFRRPRF